MSSKFIVLTGWATMFLIMALDKNWPSLFTSGRIASLSNFSDQEENSLAQTL